MDRCEKVIVLTRVYVEGVCVRQTVFRLIADGGVHQLEELGLCRCPSLRQCVSVPDAAASPRLRRRVALPWINCGLFKQQGLEHWTVLQETDGRTDGRNHEVLQGCVHLT